MKIYKATKNKKIIFEANKTVYREQTFAVGFGRFRRNVGNYEYKDYFGIGLNLFWIYISLKIILPKIIQRDEEE